MIAIISDIHGNYVALKEVLAKIDSLGIRDVFCLGDVVGYYSQVNECCDELRKRNVKCVMGNHDWYMVSSANCERSKSVRDCLEYQKKVITYDNLKWLSSFGVIIHHEGLSMVHGGWNDPLDEYMDTVEMSYFDKLQGSFFASGHTHIQSINIMGRRTYCNPGSVGQPRDGDNRSAFATFDGESFSLYRVPYDYTQVGRFMNGAGFAPYYYGCLRDASKHLHA